MLATRLIPCLDVDDGRVVKGIKFVEIRDAGDPVTLAKLYNDQKADELVFLDIGASHKSRQTMLDVVGKVSREVFIPLTVGGGIRSVSDMRETLQAGADKVAMCTSALKTPALLSEGAERHVGPPPPSKAERDVKQRIAEIRQLLGKKPPQRKRRQ